MLASTINLFNIYRGIFSLQRGPQHLPASIGLLFAMLALYTTARFGVKQFEHDLLPSLWMALADTGMNTGVILAILWARGVGHRALQMLLAFWGIGAGLNLAIIGALALISLGTLIEVPMVPGFINVVTFPFIVINLTINGHLFRESLSISLGVGVLLALVTMFLVINVTDRFDPTIVRTPGESSRMTPSPQMTPER
jgi:hypothetical protein